MDIQTRRFQPAWKKYLPHRLAITFEINEGDRVRVVEIQFEGNNVFSEWPTSRRDEIR